MNLRQKFGKNLKYFRYQKNLTQEQLAEKLDLSPNYIGYIERGLSSVNFDKIEDLAITLDIEPFQLFLNPKDIELPKRIDMLKK